jgi:CubicO group peptidase (beta-lactamase class C family)
MTSSTYSFKEATAGGHVSESWNVDTRRIPHWLLEEDIALVGGAGGIMSSASDMVNWAKLLLGSINGTAIGIPEKILQNAMSPQALIGANGMTYGYGWIQQAYAGNQV